MKYSILLTFLFCQLFLSVTSLWGQSTSPPTYYVKSDGGTGDGLSEATAWNFTFFNTKTLAPGTTVYFRRGDTFFGPLNVQSGTPDKIITYAAYGSGPSPVFSGFKLVNEWTYSGNNIYWTRLDVPELNVVTLDGKLQAMGRYPRTGYLTYNGHSGNQYITSADGIPFDPTGAEVVIRKIRQITDRHRVAGYKNNTVFLSPTGVYNTVYANNTSYQPQDGNGFFIQSSLQTLTQLGDWYYDRDTQRLYMHFGNTKPEQHQIKLASVTVLAQLNNTHHVKFQELAFEGANREIVNCNNGNTINLFNCDLRLSYGGISADNGMSQLIIQGGSMRNLLNNGLFVPQMGNGIVMDGTKLRSIGSVAGAGGSGDAMQLGIWIQGERSTVSNCSLDSIGYHGIVLYGSNTLIEKNIINTYGLVKDDCGGIYEFQFSGVQHSNKIIRSNIILNGVGVAAGAPWYAQYGQASAIYLDANVNHVQVYSNILAHGPWGGIMLAGVGTNNEITRNLTYDFAQGLLMHNFVGQPIRGLTMALNKFIAKTAQQATMYLQMYADDNPAQYGDFNRNIYARPVDDNNTMVINREYGGGGGIKTLSLAAWQAAYGKDDGSSKSVVTTDKDSNLRFDYNATDRESLVTLDNLYSDVSSTLKASSIKLPAYGGSVMVKDVTTDVNKPTDCSATGAILYEQWDNVSGATIADIPLQNTPTSKAALTSFEAPHDIADNYGSRIRGYVCAPRTGAYTFWLASDDAGELWLSTDENPANKVKIAYVDGWTSFREWGKYGSQKSAAITLQAGKKYYIEALHKEAGGGDNLSVQWQLPDGTVESPLPGKYLAPYTGVANARMSGQDAPAASAELSVFPNPFSFESRIEFTLPESGSVTVTLYNAKGQLVRRLFNGQVEANTKNSLTTNADQLPSGVYLIRLTGPKSVLTKKAILIR